MLPVLWPCQGYRCIWSTEKGGLKTRGSETASDLGSGHSQPDPLSPELMRPAQCSAPARLGARPNGTAPRRMPACVHTLAGLARVCPGESQDASPASQLP